MTEHVGISVILCTRNRAESLRQTMDSLVAASKRVHSCEFIIVDNGSCDRTRQVASTYQSRIQMRYLYEPRVGKCYALNCALKAGELREIIVFMDDDISVPENWLCTVLSICERYPQYDIFCGRSRVLWPTDSIPEWAGSEKIQPWALSVVEGFDKDTPMEKEWWPAIPFWIRKRTLDPPIEFRNLWATEADFILELREREYQGIICSNAIAEHRIQPELLSKITLLRRAYRTGRSYAKVQLIHGKITSQGRHFKDHPHLFRIRAFAGLIKWSLIFFSTISIPLSNQSFPIALISMKRMASNQEKLTYRKCPLI